jgi:N-acetylmuramoyl-L-alanine amidase
MDRRDFLRFSFYTLLSAALPAWATTNEISVVINPGHNRRNPGCFEPGVGAEYQITPQIAQRVQDGLCDLGYGGVLTRDNDTYLTRLRDYVRENSERLQILFKTITPTKASTRKPIPLEERIVHVGMAEWIDALNPLAAVHIHINDAPNGNRGKVTGYSVIVSENNLAYRASLELAQHIHRTLDQEFKPSSNQYDTTVGKRRQSFRGIMVDDILVIGSEFYRPKTPSVIVECGYITERYGDCSIRDPEVQQRYASAIAQGTAQFLQARTITINTR